MRVHYFRAPAVDSKLLVSPEKKMLSENIRDSEGSLKQCLVTVLLSVVINQLGILNTYGPILSISKARKGLQKYFALANESRD